MRKFGIGAALILFFYCPRGSLEAAESLRAASGGFTTAIHAVLWAAYEEKIFRKYGLNVEYLALNTGRLGMQMLLSDDIQVLFSTGVTAVTTNLQRPDLTIIGGGLNFFPTKLVARPEIKKPEDLKGKALADEEAAIGYDYYLAKHSEGILDLPDRRGLAFVIQETAKTNPKAVGQTAETLRLLEPSVLDEIKKSGFVEKVKS